MMNLEIGHILIFSVIILIVLTCIYCMSKPKNSKYQKYNKEESCSKDKMYKFVPAQQKRCPNTWTAITDTAYTNNTQISSSRFSSVFIDPSNGKAIATTDTDMYRFNTDGTLDLTFGVNGIVDTSVTGLLPPNGSQIYEADGWARTIINNGNIYIIGDGSQTFPGGVTHSVVQKFDSDGNLDLTFGVGGVWQDTRVGIPSSIYDIVIDANGDLLLAGSEEFFQGTNNHVIIKLTSDGVLDVSFGSGGFARVISAAGEDPEGEFRGIGIQSNGKIVAGGTFFEFQTSGNLGYGVARFNSDGTLDASYGQNAGWTQFNPNTFTDSFAFNAVINFDDMYVSGYIETNVIPFIFQNTVIKFDVNGLVDLTWGDNGVQTFHVNDGVNPNANFDQSQSFGIPCDGGSFVAGLSQIAPAQFEAFAYKLDNNGQLDLNFETDGIFHGGSGTSFDDTVIYNTGDTTEIYAAGQGLGGFATITRFVFINAPII
jgi:uncharacterized delta-60 repeat protein